MTTVNFYLDKPDKKGCSPIHLVIRAKGNQIKVATGEKINIEDWDKENQLVKDSNSSNIFINKYLCFLKKETESYLNKSYKKNFTDKEIKNKVNLLVSSYKTNNEISIVKEQEEYYGKKITFIDFFAGAGGFSEGFLQAEFKNKIYDFLFASDINENCELTHIARYNHQLGLDVEFLKQDITEPDFLNNLMKMLKGKQVDVVCGGPPCQSFSLAGKRKKFDKKDDLFAHYLNVIRHIRPKYFVMENVKGILTKEEGKIKEMILQEIRSIIDITEFPQLISFLVNIKKYINKNDIFLLESFLLRLQFETTNDKALDTIKDNYILNLENKFRLLTPKIADYKTSKTDLNINTIRHGFNLLKRNEDLLNIRKKVIQEKTYCDLDNDTFVDDFNNFLNSIEAETIVERMNQSFNKLQFPKEFQHEIFNIIKALEIYIASFDECINELLLLVKQVGKEKEFESILDEIRLYRINAPFVALASNYGVPQNRERVLFIGCRKDQKLISSIPSTVKHDEKVTVFEALYDLDFLGNDDESLNYEEVNIKTKYNGTSEKMISLLRKRMADGKISDKNGLTYAEWSKKGRLNGRFSNFKMPFYVRNQEELISPFKRDAVLHNHKTSKQNADVIKRLEIILKTGDYVKAKVLLKKNNLDSEKRNYNVLNPEYQSPTVMTIPDDYIHYNSPRALTVREMARLQSFDDSFVFQGKRSTGGNKRKDEVPQFTLVGNAIPPLLARAVACEILKNIE